MHLEGYIYGETAHRRENMIAPAECCWIDRCRFIDVPRAVYSRVKCAPERVTADAYKMSRVCYVSE